MSSSTPAPSTVLQEFDALAPPGTPLTTPEVADGFECTARTIYNKLERLVDEGVLETKKVGARGRVWWRPAHDRGDVDDDSGVEADSDELTTDQLLASVPGHYLIVEPEEYRVVAASDDYLNVTMTDRRTITGQSLFDVLPVESGTEGLRRLRASLDQVVAERQTDEMAVTHYRVPRSGSDDEFVDRWWSPINSPVFNAAGELEFIVIRAEDVTPVVERLQPDDEDSLQERVGSDAHLEADIIFRGREMERAKERVYDQLREREEQLETELAAMQQLQELSKRLLQETDTESLYEEIMDAAVAITDADFASMQRLDDGDELRLLAHRGFDSEATAFWDRVDAEWSSPCGVALDTGRRVIVPDVETCEFMAGTKEQKAYLRSGVRAAQTTPLISRDGDVLGMLSTHWRDPHEPSERDLHHMDMLVRQAADLIKHHLDERALRESERRYRELFESMTEGFCVIEKVDTDPGEPVDFRYVEANPAFADQSGLGDVAGRTMRGVIPEEASDWIEIYDDVLQTGKARRFERELAAEGRTLELYAFPVGDGTERRIGVIFQDITERKRSTEAIERLNETSRELMEADVRTIEARAAEVTRTILDVEYAALWRYDGETGEFRRHGSSTGSRIDPDAVQVSDDRSDRAWQTFIDGEIEVNNRPSESESTRSDPLRSYVLAPLGDHGVVCAGSLRPEAFDETRVDLVGTTAATLETALDRAAGEQQLARQNEELARFDRLNGLIREIDQALVRADTLTAIDQAVCERLADSDHYAFAWIGDLDSATDALTPRAWAGVDGAYVDALKAEDTVTDRSPIAAAARTKQTQAVEDLAIDTRFAPLREATLERGARSYVCVPLVYEGTLYGVLSIYGKYPQSDEHDRAVLSELGRTVAYAINAIETRETLQTNRVIELTFECRKPNTPLCRLSKAADCTIEFEGLVHRSEGEPEVFFTARDASADAVRAAGEESTSITELRCLADHGDEALFRLRATEPTLVSRFVKRNAVVRTLTIEEGRATAVVDLSHTATVREFIERLQRTVPELELHARRSRERPLKTQQTFRAICGERLTMKQEAALRTAYLSGFFESPRVSTGTEVAESLEVSQPTFTNHLRAAQRGVYEVLFEAERVDAIGEAPLDR